MLSNDKIVAQPTQLFNSMKQEKSDGTRCMLHQLVCSSSYYTIANFTQREQCSLRGLLGIGLKPEAQKYAFDLQGVAGLQKPRNQNDLFP